jgi:CheY-like chemotaxis protein
MPVMNGLEATSTLRSMGVTIPIIGLTGIHTQIYIYIYILC